MTGLVLRFVLVVLWTLSGVVLGAPLWIVVVTMVVGVFGWSAGLAHPDED